MSVQIRISFEAKAELDAVLQDLKHHGPTIGKIKKQGNTGYYRTYITLNPVVRNSEKAGDNG